MVELVLAAALVLAFVNGANDNFKGVATLYGAGVLSYRKALTLATVSTAVGALLSCALAGGLVHAFSGKGLLPPELLDARLLAAVALAAAATVLLATRLGFPISTTHALVGGIAGAGWVAAGSALDLGALGTAFALPLLAGPLLGVGLTFVGLRTAKRVSPDDAETRRRRHGENVAGVSLQSAVTAGHLVSAGLVGFARGLNDAPKILGLVVAASSASAFAGTAAIAAAMALGGLVASRRVAETLAKKITPMTPAQGLTGNLATSLLVIGASRIGVPVSTTHVSTGGIIGIGASEGCLRWRAARGILAAWITTLPVAALLGAGFMSGLG